MPHADFVHLRVHSAYSLAEGAIQIKDLAGLCQAEAMPALALTDSGNLFGALEFAEVMSKAGVQPIMGSALALAPEDGEGRRNGNGKGSAHGNGAHRRRPERIVLLARDETGYRNLLELSTKAFMQSTGTEPAEIHLADLEAGSEGLICLSGGAEGPLGRLVLGAREGEARALVERLARIFEGRFYIELQRHGMGIEQRTEVAFLDLAYDLELPLIATNDVYFATPDMHEAHDALLCIDQGTTLGEDDRRRVTAEHYFKPAGEMRAMFSDLPEAVDNTLVVARRCAYRAPLREPILPRFAAPGEDEAELLRRTAREGLEARLATPAIRAAIGGTDESATAGADPLAPYRERLAFELGVIVEMGFAGYFMIVADFVQWAKREGIPVGPGRGSGAGSVVAWALGITDLDPLRFGLLFERFLNPDRVSMPDFDIDFCQDQRDRVIHYVQEKYGHDQVAQIITFGKLQARAVLRDVGRVLAMPYGQVDRLSKLVPNNPANPVSLAQALEAEPRLREERERDPTVGRLIAIAMRLEGLYRHASTHAAGVVIGDRPLVELVPLYRDPRSEMPVTQFSMKWVEAAGLVKFDFLGLKTLTVIQRALALLARRGVELDIDAIPLDDPPTYAMLKRAEAVGIFQFESGGMRDLLRDSKPSNIEDLIALVALFRPGPMENIPKYIACKHGREQPEHLHETIEPVVKDTYGVIIYQEQVMRIAQVFAGYTLGQADLLRRAMGKKIKAEMEAQRDGFVEGAKARGVSAERASYVFDLVDKFAGYGFNKAHSAAYALVAYQTAYLKANFSVEFLAASMTLDLANTDKLNVFRQELDRLGVELLAPDINRSEVEFAVEAAADGSGPGAVRYALAAIRNVGRGAMGSIVEERRGNGEFTDLWDFARRIDPRVLNKRSLENLARAGAFDALAANRAQVLAAVELLLRYANRTAEERESSQTNLFGEAGDADEVTPALPLVAEWNETDKLAQEFDAIGFYLSAHPLDACREVLELAGVVSHAELGERMARGANRFNLAGTILSKRERNSARGKRYAFVQLSDSSGMYEVAVFSETLTAQRDLLEVGRSVVIEVDAREEGDSQRLTVQSIRDIEQVGAESGGDIRIFLHDESPLSGLGALLAEHKGGRSAVHLAVRIAAHREVEVALEGRYAMTTAVRGALKSVPGVIDVQPL